MSEPKELMSGLKEHQFCESDEFFREYPGPLSNETHLYYLKSEADKVIAHHKYKRCLAMACRCRLRARWFGDNAFYKKEQWALKWHRRWLELAEKFKEGK